jgi:hypothetical protein
MSVVSCVPAGIPNTGLRDITKLPTAPYIICTAYSEKSVSFGVHNKEVHILYTSPNVITAIKLKMMGWAGHATRASRGQMHTNFRRRT